MTFTKTVQLLAAIVNSSDDAIVSKTLDGIITSWNQGAEKIYGYKAKEVLGKSFSILTLPEKENEMPELLERIKRGAPISHYETQRKRKDGTHVDVSLTISPVRDVKGKLIGASVIGRDITERKRMEREVGRYRIILEAAPIAMIMANQRGKIMLVNDRTEKLFGYSRGELLGKVIEDLMPLRFREGHPSHRANFFRDPKSRAMGAGRDLYGLLKDGTEVPIEIGLNPVETEDGMSVLATIIDITERKKLEDRFRLALEAAPNAMIMVNPKGEIVLINKEAISLFGYQREELMGKSVEILVPQRFQGKHPSYRDDFFGKPQVRAMGAGRDLFGIRKDGQEVPVEIGLNPIFTMEGTFVIASIIDITERKRLDQAKTEFINVAAHELRTPLAVIADGIELLQTELPDALSTDQQEIFQMLQRNSQRLSRLINNLLDLSRFQSGRVKINYRTVNVSQIIHDIANTLKTSLEERGLALKGELPSSIEIHADQEMLTQVLTNLISNAIKFAKREIKVDTRIADGFLTLIVEDDGPGIPPDRIGDLFKKFSQLERPSRGGEQKGTGLGLAICKEIVELHGGTIQVENRKGGARFYVKLPQDPKKAHLS